jgi:hypothetical protein
LIITCESPAMAAASAGETEEGFMEHLQKASDEAIDLIYEMFGMKSKGGGNACVIQHPIKSPVHC